MLIVRSNSVDNLYLIALEFLMNHGNMTMPRGYQCLELSPFCTILNNIQYNILTNSFRKASKRFMAAELLWILLGRNDVEMIGFYSKKIKAYSDDGLTFFGAYGPPIMSQFSYVENALRQDPWTRQAVLTIWRENPPVTKDVPCTITMQFIRRPLERLNLNVYMRSQDAWLGFPYDIHNFTCLQLILAAILGLEPGELRLMQGSFHVYQEHYDVVNEILSHNLIPDSMTTPLSTLKSGIELDYELRGIEMTDDFIRANKPEYQLPINNFINLIKDPLLKQKLTWLAGREL
jgi:thymidylate synthase